MTVVDDVAPAPGRSQRRSRTIIAVLAICGMTVSLQQTLVVPLLPDFPKILNSTTTNVGWLVTITLLTGSVATPIVTKLADMFGKRRMMLVCLAAMVIGSAVAALGGNFLWVVIGRGLQGIAVAQIPTGISIMRDELPREKVPAAVALMSATLGIGSAIGLPLSGSSSSTELAGGVLDLGHRRGRARHRRHRRPCRSRRSARAAGSTSSAQSCFRSP